MIPALSSVIETAYRQFACPPPSHLGVCLACCMPQDIHEKMLRTAPGNLSVPEVQEWFSAAAENPMPDAVCRFLLPRVLDGLARGEEVSALGQEVALQRFAPFLRNDPHAATLAERFMRAYLADFVQRSDTDACLDDALCMFVRAGWEMDRLADVLFGLPGREVMEKLWRDWVSGSPHPAFWRTAFWPNGQGADAFYFDPRLRAMLEGIIVGEASEETIARACAVWDVLAWQGPSGS